MSNSKFGYAVPAPRILIFGCGGSGNNTLNRITHLGVEGAITAAIDTDKQQLDHTRAKQKLLLGRAIARGMSTGGSPSTGRKCAEAGRDVIAGLTSGADIVFITTGLGGGTGTGVAPIVAEEAKRAGALVVAVVTTPFAQEKPIRMTTALEWLDTLRQEVDTVLLLDNNRIMHYVPNLPLDEAFSIMDQLIAEIVKGIVETITLPSLINLDFDNVRYIMKGGGLAMMLYGESDRGPEEVVHESLNHPLLDIDIDGATGALIHVTGGPYMTQEQTSRVIDLITGRLSPGANVIFGARQDPGFGDTIKVMVIITGMDPRSLGSALNPKARPLIPQRKISDFHNREPVSDFDKSDFNKGD